MKYILLLSCFVLSIGCASQTSGQKENALDSAQATRLLTPEEKARAAFKSLATELGSEKPGGRRNWTSIEQKFATLTQKFPTLAQAWYNLGVAREGLGRIRAAETAYRKAISLNPDLSKARQNLAGVVLRLGDKQQAIAILRELVALDPGAPAARTALARSLMAAGQYDEAKKLAHGALASDAKNLGAYCILSQVAVKAKEHQRVRLLMNQGLKIDKGPKSACLHHSIGLVLLAEGETAKALVEFGQAVKKDAKSTLEAWFRIAEISMEFKNFTRAVESYDAVTKLDPMNIAAYLNLGVAYKGTGQFEKSKDSYLTALELAGSRPLPQAHFNLGVLYLRNLNKLKEAHDSLTRYKQLASPKKSDPVFGWLKEIEQRQAMESEMNQMSSEAPRK